MTTDTREFYFELEDHVGVKHDDDTLEPIGLEPLAELGIVLQTSTVVEVDGAQELVSSPERNVIKPAAALPADGYGARIVPGTRLLHTNDPLVADALRQVHGVKEIETPTKAAIKAAEKLTTDAIEAVENAPDPEPNPDQEA